MITITEFVKKNLQTFNLSTSQKNIMNLRKALTRRLKQEKLWDKAERRKINGVWTRFFKESDLQRIDLNDYIIKLISKNTHIPTKQLKANNKKRLQEYEENQEKDQEKGQKQYYFELEHPDEAREQKQKEEYQRGLFQPLDENSPQMQNALHTMMLEALFNKFFTMTPEQKKQFFYDYNMNKNWDHTIAYEDAVDANDPGLTVYTAVEEKLKHPEKYYYDEKK